MKGSIRVSAKTLDDAITEALIQLGVTSDRLEYNVIEKGSAGFLGIGMKQAVIEAWKKEEKTEEPDISDFREAVKEEKKSLGVQRGIPDTAVFCSDEDEEKQEEEMVSPDMVREEPCYFGKLGKAVKKLKYGRWGRWGELITEIDGQEAGGHL